MSYLIIQTGSTSIESPAGDYDRMFLTALGWGQGDATVIRVFKDEPLPQPGHFRGAIITGSPFMVTDRAGWSERTALWLRTAVSADLPVLGVCYGHQLLTHALGGGVGRNMRGPEYGPVQIIPTADAKADPLLSVLPPHGTDFHTAHYQSAVQLPKGCHSLARSDVDPNQATRFAARVWGVQFHPEFTSDFMKIMLETSRAPLTSAGLDIDGRIKACQNAIDATGRQFLKRFVEICG